MDLFFAILIGVVVGGAVAFGVAWFMRSRPSAGDTQNLTFLQNQMNDLIRTVDSKLGESRKEMQEAVRTQFSESQRLIQDINKQVGENLANVVKGVTEVGESSKQIFSLADQLQNLEKTLKHQKQRGNLGEASLELILGNILPPDAFEMQHYFKDGNAVDAVIKTKDGLIPVDAKFSLDNYNRIINATNDQEKEGLEKDFRNDLKNRINETAKYVRPQEGTLPFAFMYIPAEAIYYDLLVNEVGSIKVNTRSLIDYAYKDKNVIIVSPTTFSAYLQSVLYGFRAFKIEESAKQIGKLVEQLTKHLKAYDEYFEKVGKSLTTTVNHYDRAQKEFAKIDKDVFKITEGKEKIGFETQAIDKPQQD